MIERYGLKEMRALFSEEAKFQAYLDVEIASLRAFSELGVVPKEAIDKIAQKARIDVARIQAIEENTKHDVIAFTRSISEQLGKEKQWFHYGLTSTDVVDTANSVQYKKAVEIIRPKIIAFMDMLKEKAFQYKALPCMGRTHGIHAEVTAFGLKFALWYDAFSRHLKRFDAACEEALVGKISGAVGNFANTSPFIQDHVCASLGLGSVNISTQTLQRDRHVALMQALVMLSTEVEKIALEVRHLQRTEVREVSEYFDKNQKGSSAMPHKKNPIASENMCGCARLMRGYLSSVLENVTLWHERDISHSSVERVAFPDAFMLLDYMLTRYERVLRTLIVNEEQVVDNIKITYGVIFSQRVMHALIDCGMSREAAYDLVQPLAMKAYETKQQFLDLLLETQSVREVLNEEMLKECFDLTYYLREVDTILERVFGVEV